MSGFNAINRDISTNGALASIVLRGVTDPSSLTEDERMRLNLYIRNYANQVYKLYRLHQRGAFPDRDWQNVIREATQLFAQPGFAQFKTGNQFFSELWDEMERRRVEEFSDFRMESTVENP